MLSGVSEYELPQDPRWELPRDRYAQVTNMTKIHDCLIEKLAVRNIYSNEKYAKIAAILGSI